MSGKNIFYYFFVFSFIIVLFSCSPQADKYVDTNIPENSDNPNDNDGNDGGDGNTQEGGSSLLITEVNKDWIEIYNVQPLSSPPISLSKYKIRSSTYFDGKAANAYYPFPAYNIEPQSYIVIRFEGSVKNNYHDIMTILGPGLEPQGSRYEGFYEITLGGKSIDYIGFCGSSDNLPVPPLTDSFSGCVNYLAANYQSFARSKDLFDSDSGSDWKAYSVPTFGGPNDVTDTTDDDQDGIPDANEQAGTTFAGMPLYEWGARVNQRDIFVHINYMDDPKTENVMYPPQASLNKIKKTFSENGFAIHFDVGNLHSSTVSTEKNNLSGKSHEVPYTEYVTLDEEVIVSSGFPVTVSSSYYKSRYMPVSRFGIFHYSLFANRLTTSGRVDGARGRAELPGNDSVILMGNAKMEKSLGKTYIDNYIAALLFHELGHNFDLRHGGNDDINYKPNHFSTMNYGYMYMGVPEDTDGSLDNFFYRYLSEFQYELNYKGSSTESHKRDLKSESFRIDYSDGEMPLIDELNIVEINPLGAGIGNIDWNFNEEIETKKYKFNLNPYNDEDEVYEVLQDYDEWGNIKLPFDYGKYDYDYFSLSSTPQIPSRFQHLSRELAPNTISCEFHEHRFFE